MDSDHHHSLPPPPHQKAQRPSDLVLESFLRDLSSNTTHPSPTPSLESIHQHLKDHYDRLASTLAIEREQFRRERSHWSEFKSQYANLLIIKLHELNQKPPSSSHHPLTSPSSNLTNQTQAHHHLPKPSHPNRSNPISLDHSSNLRSPTLSHPSTTPQQSTTAQFLTSSHPSTRNTLNPREPVPNPYQSSSSPSVHPAPLSPSNSSLARSPSHEDIGKTTHVPRELVDENLQNSKSLQCRPSSQKRLARTSSMVKNLKSPQSKLSPSRRATKNHDHPSSHRVKPQAPFSDQIRLKIKNVTPQTLTIGRKRSNPSLFSSNRTRLNNHLPKPKWIRYSDRKARKSITSKLIWNDPSQTNPQPTSNSKPIKVSEQTKLTTGAWLSHNRDDGDVFNVSDNSKQTHSIRQRPPNTSRPIVGVNHSSKLGPSCHDGQQQRSRRGELSTTEESSQGEDDTGLTFEQRPPLELGTNLSKPILSAEKAKSKSVANEEPVDRQPDFSSELSSLSSSCEDHPQSSSSPSSSPSPFEEDFPGQKYMRKVHRKRQRALRKSLDAKNKQRESKPELLNRDPEQAGNDSMAIDDDLRSKFEIDPNQNFGVNHVFDQVGRGKAVRKQMRGRGCECCSGYYEQAAKDLNLIDPSNHLGHRSTSNHLSVHEHQNQISRHRHFNPPPLTPPDYWQMGFPDTPQVERINRRAEENKRLKLDQITLQTRAGIGPYKFKAPPPPPPPT